MSALIDSSDLDGTEKLPVLASLRIEVAACSEIRCAEKAVAMDKSYDGHKLLDKKDMIDKRTSLVEMKWLFVAN